MKYFISLFLVITCTLNVFAQEKPVKIVFDVTSSDTKVHQSAMRHVKAMSKAYPDSQFEVVMYSVAMYMVLKGKSTVEEDMESLSSNENVSFVICEGTMKRHEVDESEPEQPVSEYKVIMRIKNNLFMASEHTIYGKSNVSRYEIEVSDIITTIYFQSSSTLFNTLIS